MRYLIQYGNNVLSNKKFGVYEGDHYSSSPVEVQASPGARNAGSTVVNTRVGARTISVQGNLNKNTTKLVNVVRDLNYVFNQEDKLFRIVPPDEWREIFTPIVSNGFTASDDAINLSIDDNDIQISEKSITFDIDVSVSTSNFATITYTTSTPVDLSSVANTGNFEFFLKIPNVQYISNVEFRIGNDSSNYYSYTFDTNLGEESIDYGWNCFSIPWGNDFFAGVYTGQTYSNTVSETGSVNDAQLDYMQIRINYTADQVDSLGCAFGGLVWVNEPYVENYPCYLSGSIPKPQDNSKLEYINWKVSLLNYTGYSRGTHEIIAATDTASASDSNIVANLMGNTEQLPELTLTVEDSTGFNSLALVNARNDDSLTITPGTITTNDVFVLGGLNKIFQQSGINVNYSGKVISYEPGINPLTVSFLGTGTSLISIVATTGDIAQSNFTNMARRAQQFTAITNGVLQKIVARIRNNVAGTYAINGYIQDDNGLPNTVLGALNGQSFTNTAYTDVTFPTGNGVTIPLISGNKYWVILYNVDGTTSRWSGSTTSTYAGGISAASNTFGSTWTGTTATEFDVDIFALDSFSGDVVVQQKYYPLYV